MADVVTMCNDSDLSEWLVMIVVNGDSDDNGNCDQEPCRNYEDQ